MSALHTPETQINRWLQHAVAHVAAYLADVKGAPIVDEYSFFAPYLASIQQEFPNSASWVELDVDTAWNAALEDSIATQPQVANFPLGQLRQTGLTNDHLWALMLVGLVELDARFGRVYSELYPLPDEFRLTVGLLDDLLHFNRPDNKRSGWQLAQDLNRYGLVNRHYPDRPRAAQALSVPSPVWDTLCGEPLSEPTPHLSHLPQSDFKTLEELESLLPDDLLKRLRRFPTLVSKELIRGVILRGMRGCGRLRALGAVARHLGQDIVHIQRPPLETLPDLCRLAGALAILKGAIPVIDLELAPGETVTLPPLAGYEGMFGVILNREGSLQGPQAEKCLTLEVPTSNHQARQRQWSQVLRAEVNGNQAVVDQVSQRYHLNLGTVEQAGQLARAYAALNEHPHVEVSDVQDAYRSLNQQSLENLATRIPVKSSLDDPWDDLIVSQTTRTELENLICRCRHRETLLSQLGKGFAGASRGVRALFSGASGTGKTLASRIVSTELGLELYRVDLSSVVSKYIGETERNLSQLFARAEEQDIILLLDEGDSLLTARTDVRTSNDRYANMETNYLLQRLEFYDGIILITSNAANHIDTAFQRRMDVTIEFGLPDAGHRQRLWLLHLPENNDAKTANAVSESFLRQVALRCALTGGQIRNAALHATLLAVDAHQPISNTFLAEGIRREYTKMGAASPLN